MNQQMTFDEARAFFAELFYGEHHIPSAIKEFGYGWQLTGRYMNFATTDYNNLTRLVLMAHRDAIRVEIQSPGPGMLRLAIWKRGREGGITESHPTIEQAIESFNNYKPG